nr:DUF4105 domain-containing protein [Paracoccus saliphilus]
MAHVLVSFGFADGRRLVFSAEIRREADEVFSSLGAFFKKFELILIAVEERDIVKLRTNYRRKNLYLFPLRLSPEQARLLLVSYLERGNQLAAKPEFYNTITANCTTVVFRLVRLVDTGLPYDWRVLASRYLPSYLFELGPSIRQSLLAKPLKVRRLRPGQLYSPHPSITPQVFADS